MTNIIKASDYKTQVKDVINTGKEKNLKIVFRDRTTNSGDFTFFIYDENQNDIKELLDKGRVKWGFQFRNKEEDIKDLKKQGCQYFICFPPHYTKPGNDKVDEFQITMFIKGKKHVDTFRSTEKYALYDVKTHECINKEIMEKGKAYKVIRFE